jgi:hypothetical protein
MSTAAHAGLASQASAAAPKPPQTRQKLSGLPSLPFWLQLMSLPGVLCRSVTAYSDEFQQHDDKTNKQQDCMSDAAVSGSQVIDGAISWLDGNTIHDLLSAPSLSDDHWLHDLHVLLALTICT